jgi:hypothetical protein
MASDDKIIGDGGGSAGENDVDVDDEVVFEEEVSVERVEKVYRFAYFFCCKIFVTDGRQEN